MDETTDLQKALLQIYKDIVEREKRLPFYSDFLNLTYSKDTIRRSFGGLEKLHEYVQRIEPEFLTQHFSTVENVFSSTKNAATNLNKKTFIVTTAVDGAEANLSFLSAIDTFCEAAEAQIIIMPCESISNSFEKKLAVFDTIFNAPKYLFVQQDTKLNENISLCSIQISAKQIKPITGLARLGKRDGSYIFASPKQFLEYMPSGHSKGKNYSIMTPGACTNPKYFSNTFVSKRLSYIAEHDHCLGAVIITIVDDKIFDFTQIQADSDGSFIHMGEKYSPDGNISPVKFSVAIGDLHATKVNRPAFNYFTNLYSSYEIENVFLHDIFNGSSISHHTFNIGDRAKRHESGGSSLEGELLITFNLVKEVDRLITPETIYIVKSNHDEVLDRYLREGRYIDDPENHRLSLQLAEALFNGEDTLKYAFETIGLVVPTHWVFLSRNDSLKLDGVECAAHGDLGINGGGVSLNSLEAMYGSCVVMHSHTPAIQRGVFRGGTLSEFDMGYNRGASSWVATCCNINPGGSRQLINWIPPAT